MSTSEYIDPYDTSSTDIGHSGHTLKTLFEGMRDKFYDIVDCLNEKTRSDRIKILGPEMCTTLETLLVNMAMTCWTNKEGNVIDIESLHDKKHLERFNHILMKTVSEFIDGLSNVYQNIEIEKGTWKGRVVTKIDNLCLEWNS